MKSTHNIKYEGLELEVTGEFKQDEPEVGYKGGWSWSSISNKDGIDISWMLKSEVIDKINQIVIEEIINYESTKINP